MTTTYNTTWVSARTWSSGELVTASIMNAHVRDQLNAVKTPASFYCVVNEGADYTTTSATFADVDATDLGATFTTAGGLLFVCFSGCGGHVGNGRIFLDVVVDGTRYGGDDGIIQVREPATPVTALNLSFSIVIAGLSAASHVIKLQWKTSGATATMYAGAGTSNGDLHPMFAGFEV